MADTILTESKAVLGYDDVAAPADLVDPFRSPWALKGTPLPVRARRALRHR
jgi:hypothetical protein